MNIVFMGLPGAGKGTQAHQMAIQKKVPHISTGEIFRAEVRAKTPLGLEVNSYTSVGKLVPDEITIQIIEERLIKDDCIDGFILDGFPRTVPQAVALDELLKKIDRSLDLVVYINVDQDELVTRLSGRRTCNQCGRNYHIQFSPPAQEGICQCGGELHQREDDKEQTVMSRLQVSTEKTEQLLSYYDSKRILHSVDGTRSIEEVSDSVLKLLQVCNP